MAHLFPYFVLNAVYEFSKGDGGKPEGTEHIECGASTEQELKKLQLSFPGAQTVKRLSTMRETWVRSLGQEDPLEKEMAIHSSTIAWKIPWTEEPGRLQSMGLQRVGHN